MRKEKPFICGYSPSWDTEVHDSQLGAGSTDYAVLVFEKLMMQREARLYGPDSG